MKRKILFGAAFVALGFALYAAVGYWLAPRLILDALQKRAVESEMKLSVEDVRTDPFRLKVALQGVELTAADGPRLATASAVQIKLAWASFLGDAWIVEQVSLASPFMQVVLGPEGVVNWPSSGERGERAAGPALRVQELSISDGTLNFQDGSRELPVELTLQSVRLEVQNLATREGEAQYRLGARIAEGGTLASNGTFSLSPLAAHGELSLAAVPLAKAWDLAAHAAGPAQGQLSLTAAYAYEHARLLLHDVYAEATRVAYADVKFQEVTVKVPELRFPLNGAVPVSVQAQLDPVGHVSAHGTLDARPFMADLDIEVIALPLPLTQPFLPESLMLGIASGSLSGKGSILAQQETVAYAGSAEVHDLRLEEVASGKLLVGWKLARTDDLKLNLPSQVEIGEILVQAPQGRIVIEKGGSINFAEVFPGSGAQEGQSIQASVRRLRLESGTLHFADRSLETPFEVTIADLAGTVTGFSTAPGDPALLQLGGRAGRYGSVRIRGTINLDDPKSLADITARFRNLDLAQLTPYVAKFAGYRVRSGRVSAGLRYRVRDGRLVGQNQLVFQELQLGEKVQSAEAADLPLELAVALLADEKGRITLDIPVRGDLNEPQFDFGGLIARALGNVIGKIVSAPFRALASLFGGGGEDPGEVRFEPGTAALSPPEEENVAKVARALEARPQLGVTVRGGYDAERDAAALRLQAARREVARRAGYTEAGPLDFTDLKTLHAAENLYLERIGNRLELQALREKESRYGRALLERLAATMPMDARNAQRLASERAESVHRALLEHGVQPWRVALEAPGVQKAAREGVPTHLALTANHPAESDDLIGDAQRRLEAAGFDPGPADGKLGPMTERALRQFQRARGLRTTGELDASTITALGVQGEASVGASR